MAAEKNGRIEMTNNRAERAVKSFVIARKNFLFLDTSRGSENYQAIARRAEQIYKVAQTIS